MRTRINFTQRRRIRQSDISIELSRDNDSPMSFKAQRSLDDYNLPPNALVYLEAYRRNYYVRFDWGTVAEPRSPGSGARLTGIDGGEAVYFRVKVVAATSDGMILAQADRIKVSVSDESILPVYNKDLEDVVWRLSFDDDEPYLDVNSRIPGIMDVVRYDADFAALVFPTVVRGVLQRLCQEVAAGGDDQQRWIANWQEFSRDLTRQPVPTSEGSAKEEWMDTAVNAFARKHRLLSRYQESLNART